jgi:hypothetical protein
MTILNIFPLETSSLREEEVFQQKNKTEVVGMENQRKATQRQLAYIQQLRQQQRKESLDLDEELSSQEASNLIKNLLEIPNRDDPTRPLKINEARLGMAFKCCYRNWVTSGENIFRNKNAFIKKVLDTYPLANEIAQELSARAEG